MKKYTLILILFILSPLSSTLCFANPDKAFTRMIVFGDSLSDTGNIKEKHGADYPPKPYHEGRFANGPIYVDFLSQQLGIDPQNVLNYAVGGARAHGPGNSLNTDPNFTNAFGEKPFKNLNGQVKDFLGSHKVEPQKDLFVMYIASNDYIPFFRGLKSIPSDRKSVAEIGKQVESLVQTTVAKIQHNIKTLKNQGASYFLVPNLAPFEKLPLTEISLRQPFSNDASLKQYQDKYRTDPNFITEFTLLENVDQRVSSLPQFQKFQNEKYEAELRSAAAAATAPSASSSSSNSSTSAGPALNRQDFLETNLQKHASEFMVASLTKYQQLQKQEFLKARNYPETPKADSRALIQFKYNNYVTLQEEFEKQYGKKPYADSPEYQKFIEAKFSEKVEKEYQDHIKDSENTDQRNYANISKLSSEHSLYWDPDLDKKLSDFLALKYDEYIWIKHRDLKPQVMQFIAGTSEMHNGILAQELQKLAAAEGITIEIADVYSFMNEILADPSKHNFDNSKDPLFDKLAKKTSNDDDDTKNHVFVDPIHPTSEIHSLITKKMMPQIQKMADQSLAKQRLAAASATSSQSATSEIKAAQTGQAADSAKSLTGLNFTGFNPKASQDFEVLRTSFKNHDGPSMAVTYRPFQNFLMGVQYHQNQAAETKDLVTKPQDKTSSGVYTSLFNQSSYLNFSYQSEQESKRVQTGPAAHTQNLTTTVGHNFGSKQFNFGPILEWHHKTQQVSGFSEISKTMSKMTLLYSDHQNTIDRFRLGQQFSFIKNADFGTLSSNLQVAYDQVKLRSNGLKISVPEHNFAFQHKLGSEKHHEFSARFSNSVAFDQIGTLNLSAETKIGAVSTSKERIQQNYGASFKVNL